MAAAEDAPLDLEAEVRGYAAVRTGNCGVCRWLESRDDAAEWDRLMALPPSQIQHKALRTAMSKRGFVLTDHRIGQHRREKHRVA